MKTTIETLTIKQVRQLRDEAAQHGDRQMVRDCDRALNDRNAIHETMLIVEAINNQEAQS